MSPEWGIVFPHTFLNSYFSQQTLVFLVAILQFFFLYIHLSFVHEYRKPTKPEKKKFNIFCVKFTSYECLLATGAKIVEILNLPIFGYQNIEIFYYRPFK